MGHVAPVSTMSLYNGQGRRKYLTPSERECFMAEAEIRPSNVATFCLMLAWTGCRITEARNITWADLDARGGMVAIHSLKKRRTGVVREIPVPTEFLTVLIGTQEGGGSGDRIWPFANTTAWRYVKDVMAADAIAGLAASPKGLRHGFGVHAIRSGVPLNLLQRWLGHADIATTAIYTEVMGAEEREIAERMWKGRDQRPSDPQSCGSRCDRCSMPANLRTVEAPAPMIASTR